MRFETVFARVSRPIEDWLAQLGLARYADAFVAAGIDLDILGDLTDADLLELGVPLGDRKRILRASALSVAAASSERRHPTVIYCDLVDSTDLAVRLDPRELRAVMAAYHARCADVVAAHGGEAQYLGGGVMVAFAGGPGNAEDADRATRCALALLATIGALPFPDGTRLQTRIGIATGSEAGPSTPSLAARLQRFADPESVLVAEPTRGLIGDAFTLTSLGSRAVTGLAERVEVWRVEPIARGTDESAPRGTLVREPAVSVTSEPMVIESTLSEPRASEQIAEPLGIGRVVDTPKPTVGQEAFVTDSTGPEPHADPPFIERHFEDEGDAIASLHRWQNQLERAEGQHAPALRLEALHASWTLAFYVGDLSYALDATARGLALYDAQRHDARRVFGSGHDAGVCAAGYRALTLILAGRIAEGRSWMRRTETSLARFEDPDTRCAGLLALAIARDLLGEYDVAVAIANDARKLASKHRFVTSLEHAALVSAAARIAMGDHIAGRRALEDLLDAADFVLPGAWRAYYLVRLAFAEIAAGNERAARARLATAKEIANAGGGCIAAAELERATAALLRSSGAAHALVSERLEVAAQNARAALATLLELRAENDLLEFALSLSDSATNAAALRVRLLIERFDGRETTVDLRRARMLEQRATLRS